MAELRVCAPSWLIRHLHGEHVLLVLVGFPVQTVVNVILVVLGGVGIGVRPEVALVGHEAEATVLDAILQPADNLALGDAATFGEGKLRLAVEAGIEQPYTSHHTLGSPLRGTPYTEVGILLRRTELDGVLKVGGNLCIHFVGRGSRKVLRNGAQHEGYAVEHLDEVEVIPCTEEIDLTEQLFLGLLGVPSRYVVDGLKSVVGTVDTGIALLPKGFHPVDVSVHKTVYTLGTDVTLATTAQTVVGGDVENEEGVFLRIGQVAVHHRINAVNHLEGVGLVDGEVRGVLHREVIGVEEVVARPQTADYADCADYIFDILFHNLLLSIINIQ